MNDWIIAKLDNGGFWNLGVFTQLEFSIHLLAYFFSLLVKQFQQQIFSTQLA